MSGAVAGEPQPGISAGAAGAAGHAADVDPTGLGALVACKPPAEHAPARSATTASSAGPIRPLGRVVDRMPEAYPWIAQGDAAGGLESVGATWRDP
jgi:hypothetical protein